MKILAIETSSSTLSVAVCIDSKIVCEYFYNAGMIHSEVLISVIETALKNVDLTIKDIDKFAVSSGPGSFTGIRVGMTVVKTLAQSLKKPVVCFNCLDILQAAITIQDLSCYILVQEMVKHCQCRHLKIQALLLHQMYFA